MKKTRPKIGYAEAEGFPMIFIKEKSAYILYLFYPDFAELRRIIVDEKFRRKGYGKILVKELIKITKSAGLNEIRINSDAEVGKDSFADFLISVGFKRTGNPPFLWEKKI